MSDYANRLSALSTKKQALLAQETLLIEKRKKEMGRLAEKFGLLTLTNTCIAGLFLDVQLALNGQPEKIKLWETKGAEFLQPKRHGRTVTKSST